MDENQIHHAIEQAYQLIVEAHRNMTEIWRNHVLFTRQWWLGVGLSICPWLIWIGIRDQRATGQFLLSGFTIIIVSSWLDQLGISMGLWHYHWEVIPFMPANFPWNFSLLPVTVMFLNQYKPEVNPLIKALLFGGFPLLWPSRSHKWQIYIIPFTGSISIHFRSMSGCILCLQALPEKASIAVSPDLKPARTSRHMLPFIHV
ncbi:CBO0543 family protein [Paenibacillus shunpengii]|uniref:CBO0543 family protein n=1 Tax=Paenibacillus shunpengii TaxID=2054424 RepID=A0ABW5SV39_9BACL